MKNSIICLFLFFSFTSLWGQFPGKAGTLGSTAIHKDSSVFTSWATACTVYRGFQDISSENKAKANAGDSLMATGKAGANGSLSLGDGGYAILTFAHPITNTSGADFAVFENAFDDQFLELAFVAVSSDGLNYVRFPATSYLQNLVQIGPFDAISDPSKINNLAGKYRAMFGTPFDLEELKGIEALDINAITHVKISDVVGSINPSYASYDQYNNVINDPFPTPFASCGFDLDAVGVIHSLSELKSLHKTIELSLYPNPISKEEATSIKCSEYIDAISIFESNGKLLFKGELAALKSLRFEAGVYFIMVTTSKGDFQQKLIVE